MHGWVPTLGPGGTDWHPGNEDRADYPTTLLVTEFEVPIYARSGSSFEIGHFREGARVYGRKVSGRGCRGNWYQVLGGGYACSADGLALASPDRSRELSVLRPRLNTAVPFRYGRVMTPRAPRLDRLPSASEVRELDRAMDGDGGTPDVVEEWLEGDYFLALVGEERVGEQRFYRTIRGRYVRAQDVKVLDQPPMRGEQLGERYRLPLAFVAQEAPLVCMEVDGPRECGIAEQQARFTSVGVVEVEGKRYVRSDGDFAVAEEAVRLVRKIARPKGVPAEEKWVHIDLERQALVAYEGDRPVYATLVSSGKDGYETPTGLYRVNRKYLTKTMRGKDDESGRYEVQEVPWTMFYHRNFALHGAYWHNKFGNTKSHGCTNVPPADARWLYYWSAIALPQGWHAVTHKDGTYFYFTDTP